MTYHWDEIRDEVEGKKSIADGNCQQSPCKSWSTRIRQGEPIDLYLSLEITGHEFEFFQF